MKNTGGKLGRFFGRKPGQEVIVHVKLDGIETDRIVKEIRREILRAQRRNGGSGIA